MRGASEENKESECSGPGENVNSKRTNRNESREENDTKKDKSKSRDKSRDRGQSKDKEGSKRSRRSKRESGKITSNKSRKSKSRSHTKSNSKSPIKAPDDAKFDKLMKEVQQERKEEKKKASKREKVEKAYKLDNTQWEFTDYKDEFRKYYNKDNKSKPKSKSKSKIGSPSRRSSQGMKPPSFANPTAVPGENHQIVKNHGEYLLAFPKISVILAGLEVFMYLMVVTFLLLAVSGDFQSVFVPAINLVIMLILAAGVLFVLVRRMHVNENVDLNGQQCYVLDPMFRRGFILAHLLRLSLCLACVGIFLFWLTSGDESMGFCVENHGLVSRNDNSLVFFVVSSVFCVLGSSLALLHIVYFFKGKIGIRTLC